MEHAARVASDELVFSRQLAAYLQRYGKLSVCRDLVDTRSQDPCHYDTSNGNELGSNRFCRFARCCCRSSTPPARSTWTTRRRQSTPTDSAAACLNPHDKVFVAHFVRHDDRARQHNLKLYSFCTRGYGAADEIPIAVGEASGRRFTIGLAEIVLTEPEGRDQDEAPRWRSATSMRSWCG